MRRWLVVCLVLFLGAVLPLGAQIPTGKIEGRVSDASGPLPGVTVTVSSPSLQGTRSAVSGPNGDFSIPLLPPGEYTVRFELSGFQTLEEKVKVNAAQVTRVDALMQQGTFVEEVTVTGAFEPVSTTTQAAVTFEKTFVEDLPVGRTLDATTLLAPGVTNTGPNGGITVSGAMSYENLWLVNGVVLNENIRGQALPLFIEDAIQETTVSTAGISAEYGRFSGGVITAITKSGGNEFSGSLRDSLFRDVWQEPTPKTVARDDKVNHTYEATLGGRIIRDRLWFFLAGRQRSLETTGQTAITQIPYPITEDELRWETKLTFSLNPSHRFVGSYTKRDRDQGNNSFGTVMDLRSLYDRSLPEYLMVFNYNGAIGNNFFVEAQYSERELKFVNSGSRYRDLIYGTLLLDQATGRRFWSPTFCGVCTPEVRANKNYLAKGTYFWSTEKLGSHDITFGYDAFDDIRAANNHQSGSDFRIYLNAVIIGQEVYARLVPNSSYLMWNPILKPTQGTDFWTKSFYINDRWRLNKNFSFNIGVRYDKNDGTDQEGKKVIKDSKISPRLGLTWDPKGDGQWTVNASYGVYVMAIANSQGDASSAAGNPATYTWTYTGPAINANCSPSNPSACLPTEQVLQQFWQWFDSIGGTNNTNYRSVPSIPGGNIFISDDMASPDVREYMLSVARSFGSKGSARIDFIKRKYGDFYAQRTDLTTGQVTLPNGRVVDKGIVVNEDSLLERKYDAVQISADFRPFQRLRIGGNYTYSKAFGNWDGETGPSGPVRSGILMYPEYRDIRWYAPKGRLAIDQKHRARLWASYDIFTTKSHRLNVSFLQTYMSGTPYGAVGTISLINRNPGGGNAPYVTNPGYRNPPTTQTYYFTNRDAYRTPDITSTDIAFNYSFFTDLFGSRLELFVQPEVRNVFNHKDPIAVDTTVYTRVTQTGFDTFNPFTETPRECPQGQSNCAGYHWQKGPNFGKPTTAGSYQTPRTFLVSLGVRF
ncbi:MAG: carboxypeptidase regulatory-like domain-containing protein [Acidobacteriota bacterium]